MNANKKVSETEPLWNADDQSARLVELTSDEPHVKEAPLRRDVRSLGRLLGEVLKEQAGETLFNAVEEIRQLAIEYRELEHEARQDVGMRVDRHLSAEGTVWKVAVGKALAHRTKRRQGGALQRRIHSES